MKTRIYSLMLLTMLMLAACGGAVTPPSAGIVIPTQPAAPTAVPFVSPLESPIPIPAAPAPGGGLITKPESAKWNNAPQAALNARKMLMDELKVDVDLIGLVSAEQVDWPDGCLGIQTPGVMCIQVITTGYRVVLSANGSEYEFHTNLSGDVVLPVPPAQ
ncbi:MAG: hypothetical protein KA765_03590 [Thermoflexales bacterium]|nr:hypothetical protein [Thermoflexales bacterium]